MGYQCRKNWEILSVEDKNLTMEKTATATKFLNVFESNTFFALRQLEDKTGEIQKK